MKTIGAVLGLFIISSNLLADDDGKQVLISQVQQQQSHQHVSQTLVGKSLLEKARCAFTGAYSGALAIFCGSCMYVSGSNFIKTFQPHTHESVAITNTDSFQKKLGQRIFSSSCIILSCFILMKTGKYSLENFEAAIGG